MSLSFVSAGNWDNVRSYDPLIKEITITNALGLGEDLMRIKLLENTEMCSNDCYAILEINNYEEIKLSDRYDDTFNWEFENLRTTRAEDIIHDFKIAYTKSEVSEQIGENCRLIDVEKNITECLKVMQTKEIYNWEDYKFENNVLPVGNYWLKLEGSKSYNEIIDWQPTFIGIKVNEWAKWGAVTALGNFTFDGTNIGEDTGTGFGNMSTNLAQETTECVDRKCANMTSGTNSQNTIKMPIISAGAICFWFKPNISIVSEGNKVLVQADSGGFDLGDFNIALNDFGIWGGTTGNLYFMTQTASMSYRISYNMSNVNLNDWQHLCTKINATGSYMFINGTQVNKTIQTGLQLFNGDAGINLMGSTGFSPQWWVDEYKIFDVEVSTDQILDMYTTENSFFYAYLNFPTDKYYSINNQINFNCSANDYSNITNITLYINGVVNETQIFGTPIAEFYATKNLDFGYYNWTCLAKNNGGLSYWADNRSFSIFGFIENSQTFNPTTTETSSETFSINLTYDSSYYSSIVANLIYNGTSYTGTSSGSENNIIFSKTITIPSVSSQTNKTFYWSIGLTNVTGTTYINSTFNNQTINPLGFGLCGGNLNIVAINFSAKNETSLVGINSFNFAGTFEIWAGTGSIVKTNSTINTTGVNSITFCISQNTTYYINAYIDYSASGFSQRSYYLRNAVINNVTNNITLYLLDSSLSTSIIINVKDRYLTNLKNHLIKVLRYYPGYGEYYLVETAKTDDFGNAIIKVQQENVDYKFIIENSSGSQIYLSNAMRIICTATPCILEFITGETEHIVQQLIDFAYVSYNLVWNNNTGYVTFDYSDSSGLTQTMRLLVIKINAYGETTICDDTISEPAGILTCYIGANATGEYSAKVYRTASPTKYFAQLNISLTNIWQKFGKEALIWMLFFVITMFFAGLAVNPATAAILTLVSMVFMMATGIVYMPLIVVISVGVVVVLFIIKMRS